MENSWMPLMKTGHAERDPNRLVTSANQFATQAERSA
jgi:hypothetical protein